MENKTLDIDWYLKQGWKLVAGGKNDDGKAHLIPPPKSKGLNPFEVTIDEFNQHLKSGTGFNNINELRQFSNSIADDMIENVEKKIAKNSAKDLSVAEGVSKWKSAPLIIGGAIIAAAIISSNRDEN